MKNSFIALICCLAMIGCAGDDQADQQRPPRAVSFVELELSEPTSTGRLAGSVESWKREDLGFEVPGRILRVVEPGENIVGRTYDEEGELLTEGTVIAELNSERYEIALRQAQAAADAARTDLEELIPKQLAEAEAALGLAQKELDRYANLVATQSASQQELDVRDSAQKAAAAKVAQVEALRATKASLLQTSLANVEQAKINIADCKLYSPFTGQIARVHMIPGGYALPGQPVVTVQMMDPMKVNIAVSAETDRRIHQNDLIRVFSPSEQPLEGMVYLKDTFADPTTRTFLVTLLVRNRQIREGVPKELQGESVAHCRNLWKLEKPDEDAKHFYLEVNAIHKDDDGHYVWKVENLTREQLYQDFDPVLTVKKVRVTVGEGRVPVLRVFTFRELTDTGELDPAVDVIAGDIDGQVGEDGKMVLSRDRWLIRPGDVVRVGMKGQETPRGFYVPENAIQFDGTGHHVAVAVSAGDGTEQVSLVSVTPGETSGSLRRIEGELDPGMKVIVEGAHYVTDGERVRTIDQVPAGE